MKIAGERKGCFEVDMSPDESEGEEGLKWGCTLMRRGQQEDEGTRIGVLEFANSPLSLSFKF